MIRTPGKVTERITLLGAPELCLYHVDGGGESVLIGGGMAHLAPQILPQVESFRIDVKKIRRLIILHTHFDHCGLVPYLKNLWPWMKIAASEQGKSCLSDPNLTQHVAGLNQAMIVRDGLEQAAARLCFEFTGIEVEEILKEGDRLVCGDLTIEILEVPGHSSCSIAAYVPEEKALFASDALGVHYPGLVFAAGNSNFDLFETNVRRLAGFDVEAVLLEHFGGALGDEARSLLLRSIEAAREARSAMLESYRRTGDVTKTAQEITRSILDRTPGNFLIEDVLFVVMERMVKFIVKAHERRNGLR
ncbi:MAG: MBL fold metallo-hydrolase [Desulfobacterota bacterium]|jgi:glyoxylase-like metal-dependent hydrolase (beta-lactamase superfamily II)|nr:MBL fold metallo-hydrolase [Thermodesulfobacteriota bacterium]